MRLMAGDCWTHGGGDGGDCPPALEMMPPVSASTTFPNSSVSVNSNVLEWTGGRGERTRYKS